MLLLLLHTDHVQADLYVTRSTVVMPHNVSRRFSVSAFHTVEIEPIYGREEKT